MPNRKQFGTPPPDIALKEIAYGECRSDPPGLGWKVSKETKKELDEINSVLSRINDPRFNLTSS